MDRKVILAVGAHPDDMDYTASGTIAKLVKEGWDAYYVVCTDGSRGSRHHKTTHKALAQVRREEQDASGKILGLKDVFFLDHEDTELMCDVTLKEELVRIIRTVKPQVVITMDPAFLYTPHAPWSGKAFINHTDHRATALSTVDAVFPLSRDRLSFPLHEKQGLTPHTVKEMWFTSFVEKGNHLVDITETLSQKIEALSKHESQFDDFPKVEKEIRGNAARFADGEDFEFAESFVRLILD